MDQTINVLHDIHYNYSQVNYFLKTENQSSLNRIIEENNSKLDELAALRFHAAEIKDQLAVIFQVSPDDLYNVPWKEDNPEWAAIIQKETEIYGLMDLVVKQNDDMVKKMEKLQNSIKKEIRSLNVTMKWHKIKDNSL